MTVPKTLTEFINGANAKMIELDKIRALRGILTARHTVLLTTLFRSTMCREELIITFLALLELMKEGDLLVARNPETKEVIIYRQEEESPNHV